MTKRRRVSPVEPLPYSGVGERLVLAVPELSDVYQSHVEFHDGLLPHVLFGDVVVMVNTWIASGDRDQVDRVLVFMHNELRVGDDRVINAVQASFVEAFVSTDSEQARFIETWPSALRVEAIRQRDWPR
jgi:hypothetical protein